MKSARFFVVFLLGVAMTVQVARCGPVFAQTRAGAGKAASSAKTSKSAGELGSQEQLNGALLQAVAVNDIPGARKAVRKGASPDAADGDSVTAIMKAALYGYPEMVDLLLRLGADPNLQDNNGNTAVVMAAWSGYAEIVRTLTTAGASTAVQAEGTVPLPMDRGMTPLMAASITGDRDIVRQLLESGVKVNLRDRDGQTALMNAVRYGHGEIANMLLINGAKMDMRDRYGRTALMLSVVFDQPGIVRLLISRGANLYLIDKGGMSASKYANALERDSILQMLKDAGVRPYKGRY
jgi:ankyrin repeat protein